MRLWRRMLVAFDGGGRRAAVDQVHRRSLSAEHCCGTTDTAHTVDQESVDPVGGEGQSTHEQGSAVVERWLFPTTHKTGRTGAMSGAAVPAMVQRRAAAAGYTPVDVLSPRRPGGRADRSGLPTKGLLRIRRGRKRSPRRRRYPRPSTTSTPGSHTGRTDPKPRTHCGPPRP